MLNTFGVLTVIILLVLAYESRNFYKKGNCFEFRNPNFNDTRILQ